MATVCKPPTLAYNLSETCMAKKTFSYYARLGTRYYVLGLPGLALQAAACWGAPSEIVNGIKVLDLGSKPSPSFGPAVKAALSLVGRQDPVRFGRLQGQVRAIANAAGAVGSDYQWPLRLSCLNFRMFCSANTHAAEITVPLMAAALIRDSTIGHLLNRGVLCTGRNRARFDAICANEARRFLQLAGVATTPWDKACPMTSWETLDFGLREIVAIVTGTDTQN